MKFELPPGGGVHAKYLNNFFSQFFDLKLEFLINEREELIEKVFLEIDKIHNIKRHRESVSSDTDYGDESSSDYDDYDDDVYN